MPPLAARCKKEELTNKQTYLARFHFENRSIFHSLILARKEAEIERRITKNKTKKKKMSTETSFGEK